MEHNLIDMEQNHYLRSTVKKQLPVSLSKNSQVQYSSFTIAGSRIWNAFPFHVKDSQTVQQFKSKLKTYTYLVNLTSIVMFTYFLINVITF